MRVHPTSNINFKMVMLSREDAELIHKLPRDIRDLYNKRLDEAPVDTSEASAKLRDNIVLEALQKARELFKK